MICVYTYVQTVCIPCICTCARSRCCLISLSLSLSLSFNLSQSLPLSCNLSLSLSLCDIQYAHTCIHIGCTHIHLFNRHTPEAFGPQQSTYVRMCTLHQLMRTDTLYIYLRLMVHIRANDSYKQVRFRHTL